MRWWRSLRLFLIAHRRGLLIIVGTVLGFYVLLNASFTAVSSNAWSCTACHFMTPYHRTWEQSSHAGVACIRCHELGFGYFTSALLKYSTGLYNPHALARVPNEACLQEDCHSLEIVQRATGFRQTIAFDHNTHLGELRRGERLWCTSCHSSDEAGSTHFTTHERICYICHFKGAEQGRSVTDCSTCHTAPAQEVEHAGFSFDHQAYVALGVGCDECHVRIVSGDAEVDPDRCHQCHVERMGRFDDFAFIHGEHVAERGISCFRCHSEITHRSEELLRALDVRCENCHSQLHGVQQQLYMGVGGRGLADVPSRMFAAKVSCEGCHVEPRGGEGEPATSYEAKRQSCIRCHGGVYDAMLDDWMREMEVALGYISPLEEEAGEILAELDAGEASASEAAGLLRDALANIELVRGGIGAHNVEYAVRLLNTSADQIRLGAELFGRPLPARTRPPVMRQPDGYCMSLCHDRLGTHGVEYFSEMEIDFDHLSHEHVSCTRCHSAQRHKQRVVTQRECMVCHHTDEGREYGVGCVDCHGYEASLYEGSIRVAGVEIEPDIMAQSDVGCADCHSVRAEGETLQQILGRCNGCHRDWGIEPLPVDQGFLEQEVSLRRRSDSLIVLLDRQRAELDRLNRLGLLEENMQRLHSEAERDLDVVLRGRAHHNFTAAAAILEKTEETVNRLQSLIESAR